MLWKLSKMNVGLRLIQIIILKRSIKEEKIMHNYSIDHEVDHYEVYIHYSNPTLEDDVFIAYTEEDVIKHIEYVKAHPNLSYSVLKIERLIIN